MVRRVPHTINYFLFSVYSAERLGAHMGYFGCVIIGSIIGYCIAAMLQQA